MPARYDVGIDEAYERGGQGIWRVGSHGPPTAVTSQGSATGVLGAGWFDALYAVFRATGVKPPSTALLHGRDTSLLHGCDDVLGLPRPWPANTVASFGPVRLMNLGKISRREEVYGAAQKWERGTGDRDVNIDININYFDINFHINANLDNAFNILNPRKPTLDTSTSAVQDTLPSTESSSFPESVTSIAPSIPNNIQTSVAAPSIPAIPEAEDVPLSSTSPIDSTTALSSQTTGQGSGDSTNGTNSNRLATVPTSDASSSASPSPSPPSTSIPISESVGASTATTTTTGSGQIESSNSGAGLTNGAQENTAGGANNTQTIIAIAGGVIGGLALISLIAFLLWLWRKRLMKKRHSTLLTPLSADAAYRGREKGPYIISRNSLGPTSVPEKMRALVGYNYHKLRGRVNSLVTRSPKPSVDLNRGNSQFGVPNAAVSRSSSRAGETNNEATTRKDRFVDWWGRLTEDGNLNWKLRNEPRSGRPNNDTYTSRPNAAQPRKWGSQPDFLTLLSADEKQKQQGSSNSNVAGSSSNPRRSQSLGNDHFLGSLGLNFDTENPFADSNAMTHDSAKVMPLAVPAEGPNNPFSDANAIPAPARFVNNNITSGPATYVQNIRRSRGHSVNAANTQPPNGGAVGRLPSLYSESRLSVDTSDPRRNKFRSDPFDLDRPELLAQSPEAATRGAVDTGRDDGYSRQGIARGLPNAPRPIHKRTESFSSKYSSGVSSMGEWSDPGPDVGPAAGRWDTPSPDSTLGRQPITRDRGKGGGSQRSVGKAM
ncbi:hypothetical protein GQX73_g1521 [Xylaria multiplex]|uniref:Uncharacterized protein n=1 Tax=Xylaria multiplex TaxID=323545 RepID=A0A7C8IVG1_9PEZI|nr:hypothetical protein GQX73_g1521 [Xylaria multiplex]